jgi:dTDP-glucose 4,6-dehydratase
MNCSKIKKELDWTPSFSFYLALEETVNWYVNNDWWWTPLLKDRILDHHPWKIHWKGKRV